MPHGTVEEPCLCTPSPGPVRAVVCRGCTASLGAASLCVSAVTSEILAVYVCVCYAIAYNSFPAGLRATPLAAGRVLAVRRSTAAAVRPSWHPGVPPSPPAAARTAGPPAPAAHRRARLVVRHRQCLPLHSRVAASHHRRTAAQVRLTLPACLLGAAAVVAAGAAAGAAASRPAAVGPVATHASAARCRPLPPSRPCSPVHTAAGCVGARRVCSVATPPPV